VRAATEDPQASGQASNGPSALGARRKLLATSFSSAAASGSMGDFDFSIQNDGAIGSEDKKRRPARGAVSNTSISRIAILTGNCAMFS